jgi:hypothetical protein
MKPLPAVRPSRRRGRRDAGFSALELTVSATILLAVFGAFATAVTDAVSTSVSTVSAASLQEEARRILDRLRRDVAMTGRIDAAVDPTGAALPAVYSNGDAPAGLEIFEHDVETLTNIASEFAPAPTPEEPFNPPPFVAPGNENEPFGFREFVFRLPRDVDGDGRIVSAVGAVEWGPELFAYLVVPRPNEKDGLCDLIRRSVAADGSFTDDVVARQVESVTFDTVETKQVLPMQAVEIHLHLLRRNSSNGLERLHVATTLVMRN